MSMATTMTSPLVTAEVNARPKEALGLKYALVCWTMVGVAARTDNGDAITKAQSRVTMTEKAPALLRERTIYESHSLRIYPLKPISDVFHG